MKFFTKPDHEFDGAMFPRAGMRGEITLIGLRDFARPTVPTCRDGRGIADCGLLSVNSQCTSSGNPDRAMIGMTERRSASVTFGKSSMPE